MPHIFSASRHEGFNDGMVWDPPSGMEELQVNLQQNHDAWESGSAYTWTIEAKEDARFIGRIAIRQTERNNEWDLGYWIHPSAQNCGYASEVALDIIAFGFTKLDAIRITAAHATWNEASGKVLQKAGMKRTGLNPKGFKKRGEWVEEFEYLIES